MYDGLRRLPDGAWDLDFHRRQAARLRAQERREFLRANAAPLIKAMVAVVIVAAALALMPGRDGSGWNGARPAKPDLNATLAPGIVVRDGS